MYKFPNAKIYKIRCNSTGRIYVGSVLDGILKKRLQSHEANYLKYLRSESNYTTSFDIIKDNNYEIILIEDYPCNDIKELHIKEGQYIKLFKMFGLPCVNKNIPGRTKKEWYKDNIEKIKEHREKNIEKEKERKKKYRENNKEKIRNYNKEYYEKDKEKKKKYYENNKEKIKEKKKQYNANRRIKITCACGSVVSKSALSQHKKSIKHQQYLLKQIDEKKNQN